MSEPEPVLLAEPTAPAEAPKAEAREKPEAREAPEKREPPKLTQAPSPRAVKREAQAVFVVGFWKRAAAALVDAAIVVPAALLITVIAGKLAGVAPPPSNVHLFDVDLWIDLVLATDPALVMGWVLLVAIALVYALVFQIAAGRTLGMRLLKMKIIDVYGDRPSPGRCAVRCLGYLVGLATLFLGFLWVGFDSEKRGLHDWIAGTYVIRT